MKETRSSHCNPFYILISSQAKPSSPHAMNENPNHVSLGTTTKGNPLVCRHSQIVPTDLAHQDLDIKDLCQDLLCQADNTEALQLYPY